MSSAILSLDASPDVSAPEVIQPVPRIEVPVVRIGAIEKHPNADTLSITQVFAYPVIFRTGEYQSGDLAAYVPVDAIVPNTPEWSFLEKSRIKAKKLRGVFSMGLLTAAPADASEGDDVADLLGITKYEEPERSMRGRGGSDGDALPEPQFMCRYTKIENYRRHPDLIPVGEEVVITEKIHGQNARFGLDGELLWVGSHNVIKKPDGNSNWAKWARETELMSRLRVGSLDGLVFFGELYGDVQDLKYGAEPGQTHVRFFDVYDVFLGRYQDAPEWHETLCRAGLDVVPVLYRGPMPDAHELSAMAEQRSTIDDGCIREGLVIRPVQERYDRRVGRVILKYISQQYLLRKGGTEAH